MDDLDALDVLRAETHDFVRRARIFRKISQDGLSVHENQCVARLCSANRDADTPHGVDRARDARLGEDDVFNGFRLLLLDVLLRDDRLLLRLVLRFFLRRLRLDVNGLRLDALCLLGGGIFRVSRTQRRRQPKRYAQREQLVIAKTESLPCHAVSSLVSMK